LKISQNFVWLSITLNIILIFLIVIVLFKLDIPERSLKRLIAYPNNLNTKAEIEKQQLYDSIRKLNVNPLVLFIGNSITAALNWQEVFPEYNILNRSIPGENIKGIYFRRNYIKSLDPFIIVTMYGINDLLKGSSVDQVFISYKETIDYLIKDNNYIIIVSTLFIRNNKSVNKNVTLLNSKLAHYCKNHENLTFLDLNGELSSGNNLKSIYTYDGIHLTVEAYKVWINKLQPIFDKKIFAL
jgi:lysophospholipase L1-like esterase